MTLELGRMSTWRLPVFSALLMAFRASLSTLVLTILAVMKAGDSQGANEACGYEVSVGITLASSSLVEREECPSARVLQLRRRRRSGVVAQERTTSAGPGCLKGISRVVCDIPQLMKGEVVVVECRWRREEEVQAA